MRSIAKSVPVIPALHLGRVHPVIFAQAEHLFLCKSRILCQWARIDHGKLIKHIQGRMCAIFFYRKDPRHIGKMDISLVFEQIPQKIKIHFLCILIFPVFPEYTVPLIDNDHKRAFGIPINILHRPG